MTSRCTLIRPAMQEKGHGRMSAWGMPTYDKTEADMGVDLELT
jgi:hypothetical protein